MIIGKSVFIFGSGKFFHAIFVEDKRLFFCGRGNVALELRLNAAHGYA
jgi:hypothetical protein